MLKTIVYQSYRIVEVPSWIELCMKTVKDWADINGFDYYFIDDRFFEYVPSWYKDKVNGQFLLVSDLARLELSKEFLSNGYDRTIWVDADVLIFDPYKFTINISEDYAFCREVWVTPVAKLFLKFVYSVNNAVSVFVKNNSFLEFYIQACQSIVKNKQGKISPVEVGTLFLTQLYNILHFPLIRTVGLFSPLVMKDIATGKGSILRKYMKHFASPIYAANLTLSYRNINFKGVVMNDKLFDVIVDSLLRTKGEIVNQYSQNHK